MGGGVDGEVLGNGFCRFWSGYRIALGQEWKAKRLLKKKGYRQAEAREYWKFSVQAFYCSTSSLLPSAFSFGFPSAFNKHRD
jgi:hypothetical protein